MAHSSLTPFLRPTRWPASPTLPPGRDTLAWDLTRYPPTPLHPPPSPHSSQHPWGSSHSSLTAVPAGSATLSDPVSLPPVPELSCSLAFDASFSFPFFFFFFSSRMTWTLYLLVWLPAPQTLPPGCVLSARSPRVLQRCSMRGRRSESSAFVGRSHV